MMKDPACVKQVRMVDCRAFDGLLKEHLGREWSVQQSEYYSNGTLLNEIVPDPLEYPECAAEAEDKVAEWLASPPAKFPGRYGYYENEEDRSDYEESVGVRLDEFLMVLANRRVLQPGPLAIHIWW